MKFLKLSPYKAHPVGHGGEKRSYQMDYFLRHQVGATCVDVQNSIYRIKGNSKVSLSFLYRFIRGFLLAKKFKVFFKFRTTHYEGLYLAYHHYSRLVNSSDANFIVWEMGCGYPGSWDFMVPLVNRTNKRILAVLHNLDSLIDGRYFIDEKIKSPDWFELELKTLKACDMVLTISWEEHWLLNLHGVKSVYYPYYPVGDVAESNQRICHLRQHSKKSGYLILGSTINLPTYKATIELLQNLSEIDEQFYVVGYGAENISKEVVSYQNIKVLGTLEQEDFEKTLSLVKAVIIYSLPTTGALTKLPELLSSGVPVFVNDFGARSYHGLKGLITYDSFSVLQEMLSETNLTSETDCHEVYKQKDFLMVVKKLKSFFETNNILE